MCEILVYSKIAEKCCKKVVYLLNYPILEQTALRVATEEFLPNVAPFRQQHSSQQWLSGYMTGLWTLYRITLPTLPTIRLNQLVRLNVQYSHDNGLLLIDLWTLLTHPSFKFAKYVAHIVQKLVVMSLLHWHHKSNDSITNSSGTNWCRRIMNSTALTAFALA